jgi:hypothetical protein
VFKDLATGALRLATGSDDGKVCVFDPVAGGAALVVLKGHTGKVEALTAFVDPATGEPRLVSGSGDSTVRIWNPATSGKIGFASVDWLPAGLDEVYAENFRRVFVDDTAWRDALPLVELVCAAAEPLTVDAASNALGWDRARCKKIWDGVSLLFPLREGGVIGVLDKHVMDWLMGEAPFDMRSSEDAFFVARDAAHRRLARACARAIRAGVLDTEVYSSDAAADAALVSFVKGDGGSASDAYALRWCLFHLKRSNNENEAVELALIEALQVADAQQRAAQQQTVKDALDNKAARAKLVLLQRELFTHANVLVLDAPPPPQLREATALRAGIVELVSGGAQIKISQYLFQRCGGADLGGTRLTRRCAHRSAPRLLGSAH